MIDYRYVPITEGKKIVTYLFLAELEEEDGRWSAWIEALPGCATWGYSKEEALEALKEAAQAYAAILAQRGQRIPAARALGTVEAPIVAVTL